MLGKKTWQTILSVSAVAIFVYFLYHTVQGDHGWMSMLRLRDQVAAAKADLSRLQGERRDLERRIHLMRPDSLDPDLVDEEARKSLNYSKPGEVVIVAPPPDKDKK